jgi:Zn-dependent peptidase ImmA (M78 family)
MSDEQRFRDAEQIAEKLVRDAGYSAPIDVFKVAADMDVVVQAKKDGAPGVSGMLIRKGNEFGIVYTTHIPSNGFQRFSIAHELGHLNLPGHPEQITKTGEHISYAGFGSRDVVELEADHFASGLLMPTAMYRSAIGRHPDGFAGIEALADEFQTSLVASAIRYARLSHAAVAIIVSRGDQIDYCFSSESLRRLPGYIHPKKGLPLPKECATKYFNQDSSRISSAERDDDSTDSMTWFHTDDEYEAVEELVGLGGYGRTLTVVTLEDDPEEEGD